MNKLLVKDPKTGETRPMTQKSFDLAGKKRGFTIVGTVEQAGGKSVVQQEMDRLRAEQAAKTATVNEGNTPATIDLPIQDELQEPEAKERKKPGPKPKSINA